MTDEARRRLEREAAGGDPAACVRVAELLVREGRRAEGARLLRSVPGSVAVQEALAKYPAWTHREGDAGRTGFADVEPVVAKPRALWKRRLRAVPEDNATGTRLLASPQGVVVWTRSGVQVRDLDGGEVVWQWKWPDQTRPANRWKPHMEIHEGHLLVASGRQAWRFALATGEKLSEIDVPARAVFLSGGVLYATDGDELRAYKVAVGEERPFWKAPVPGTHDGLARSELAIAGGLVFVHTYGGIRALDGETGAELWRSRHVGRDLRADGKGSASLETDIPQRPGEASVVFRDSKGKSRLQVEGLRQARALAPALLVVSEGPGSGHLSRAVAIDRSEGTVRGLPLVVGDTMPLAIARDVIVGARGTTQPPAVAACRATGEVLWQHDVGALAGVGDIRRWSVALLDRVIVLLLGDGTLVALSDLA